MRLGGAPFFLRKKRAGFALRRGRTKTINIINRRGDHCRDGGVPKASLVQREVDAVGRRRDCTFQYHTPLSYNPSVSLRDPAPLAQGSLLVTA